MRLLFATETFAMGVNMPARSVVFTSLRKWDGETFRPPTAAEYIQMSGRAGRRGLDTKGTVVLMLTEEVEPSALKTMMHGAPVALSSSFRLRYNTLLRLYSMESLQPDVLVRKSFYAYQRAQEVPELREERRRLLADAAALAQPDDAKLAQLRAVRHKRAGVERRAMERALQPKHALRFLQPGRLVHVVETAGGAPGGDGGAPGGDGSAELDRGWGVVLGFRHVANRFLSDELVASCGRSDFVVDVLLPCAKGAAAAAAAGEVPRPSALGAPTAEAHVLPVGFDLVRRLSAARLWLPAELTTARSRKVVLEGLRQLLGKGRRDGRQVERLGGRARRERACLHPLEHLGAQHGAVEAVEGAAELAAELAALEEEEHAMRAALAGEDEDDDDDDDDEEEADEEAEEGEVAAEAEAEAAKAAGAAEMAGASDAKTPSLKARVAQLTRRQSLLAQAEACEQEAASRAADDFEALMGKMKVRGLACTGAVSSADTSRAFRLARALRPAPRPLAVHSPHSSSCDGPASQVVLRRLGHVDADNVVQLKGRAAAEVEACDELLAAELILAGTFNDLSPAAAVALCAPLIAPDHEKIKRFAPPHADVAPGYQALQVAARTLAGVLNDARLPTDADEFVGKFDGGLINVVYAWANGARFYELCEMCELFEGSIIRSIRRLSELLDELQSAAKAIGNDELYKKFDEGAKLIRRDIVFAASLYLEG